MGKQDKLLRESAHSEPDEMFGAATNHREHDPARNSKLSTSIINELVMVFDVHRLMFKSYRILVAQAMKTDYKKFSDFMSEKHNNEDDREKLLPTTQQWKDESEKLELFMVYVKESLKFLLLSFFKQCRIILRILEKFHEMRKDRDD